MTYSEEQVSVLVQFIKKHYNNSDYQLAVKVLVDPDPPAPTVSPRTNTLSDAVFVPASLIVPDIV